MIDSIQTLLSLKDEIRTGWEIYNIKNPESVADHSWSVALLCMIYGDKQEHVDVNKAVKMAVIHDLAEAETGDIASRANKSDQAISDTDKQKAEKHVIDTYSTTLGNWVSELWDAFEAQETPTAKFVRDMDKIDMLLQALTYTQQERYDKDVNQPYDHLNEFFHTAQRHITTDTGKSLFNTIKDQYMREIADS